MRYVPGAVAVTAEFGTDPTYDGIRQDLRDKIIQGVSPGVYWRRSEMTYEGEAPDGLSIYRVARWRLDEVSVLSDPANPYIGNKLSTSLQAYEEYAKLQAEREEQMVESSEEPDPDPEPQPETKFEVEETPTMPEVQEEPKPTLSEVEALFDRKRAEERKAEVDAEAAKAQYTKDVEEEAKRLLAASGNHSVSYTHLRAHETKAESRMPSSA